MPTFLKDVFFPKFCLGCGKVGTYLCNNCYKKLAYFDKDCCIYCQKPSPYGLTHPGCRKPLGIDGFMTIFRYNDLLKKTIKSFKYRLATAVWDELSLSIRPEKLLKTNFFNRVIKNEKIFLQPIPLHPKKIRERGFNQALIITKFFQRYLSLLTTDTLIRTKETKPQASIKSKKERAQNLHNAFAVKKKNNVINRTFVLVDDLLTSGRTAEAAATTLKKNGAKKVYVLTLAKG